MLFPCVFQCFTQRLLRCNEPVLARTEARHVCSLSARTVEERFRSVNILHKLHERCNDKRNWQHIGFSLRLRARANARFGFLRQLRSQQLQVELFKRCVHRLSCDAANADNGRNFSHQLPVCAWQFRQQQQRVPALSAWPIRKRVVKSRRLHFVRQCANDSRCWQHNGFRVHVRARANAERWCLRELLVQQLQVELWRVQLHQLCLEPGHAKRGSDFCSAVLVRGRSFLRLRFCFLCR